MPGKRADSENQNSKTCCSLCVEWTIVLSGVWNETANGCCFCGTVEFVLTIDSGAFQPG